MTLDQRHNYDVTIYTSIQLTNLTQSLRWSNVMVWRWINVTFMTLDQRHNLDVYPTNKSSPISTLIQRHGLTLDQRHIYDVGSTSQLWRHNLDV